MRLEDVSLLFQFVGGLGMFLYGMNIMADGLQKSAGDRMKQLLGYLTNNRFVAILVGTLVTAIIQSSSATTVMVVGFVNAGLLTLGQAVGVIMGANIGTTVTSWLVSMSDWGDALKPEFFAPLLVGIGAGILMFCKSRKKKDFGEILVGFGLLFIGLSFMSGSIEPYSDAPIFSQAFAILGKNPILGIIAGCVVTGIIQSSSASVGILQVLAANGVVNWSSAIFITLGQNIGTCVTAMLSSAGAHKTAKRAAVIHLLFNTIGAVVFGIIMFIIFQIWSGFASSSISSTQISIFHTIFNISNTLILFPFANGLVKLSGLIIKDDSEEVVKEKGVVTHLDDRILESPSFALETVEKEVVSMGHLVQETANMSIEAVKNGNQELINKVLENEKTINQLEKSLTEYLVKVNNTSLSDKQHLVVKNLLYTISDLERIGDHAENIVELAQTMVNDQIHFSASALEELQIISTKVKNAIKCSIEAREIGDMSKVRLVFDYEDSVDALEEEMREAHIRRLSSNQCKAESGVVFLDIISNLERMADHTVNIVGYVKDEM